MSTLDRIKSLFGDVSQSSWDAQKQERTTIIWKKPTRNQLLWSGLIVSGLVVGAAYQVPIWYGWGKAKATGIAAELAYSRQEKRGRQNAEAWQAAIKERTSNLDAECYELSTKASNNPDTMHLAGIIRQECSRTREQIVAMLGGSDAPLSLASFNVSDETSEVPLPPPGKPYPLVPQQKDTAAMDSLLERLSQ